MNEAKGWVYVIVNPLMPSVMKIGFSGQEPVARAKELDGTAIAHVVLYEALVVDAHEVVQEVHLSLDDKFAASRWGDFEPTKEWFSCDPTEARDAIKSVAKERLKQEVVHFESAKEADRRLRAVHMLVVTGDDLAEGEPVFYKEALAFFHKAAEQDYAPAQFRLGEAYQKGQGVRESNRKALVWYQKAAEQGHTEAQCVLAGMYENGRGTAKNHSQAAVWWRKAAEKGDASAQFRLGYVYANGNDKVSTQDHSEAAIWFSKAAEQGDCAGQYFLGAAYANGQGVTQDYKQAEFWWREAAKQEGLSCPGHSHSFVAHRGLAKSSLRELSNGEPGPTL